MARWLALPAVLALACGTDESNSGDPYPIDVDCVGGALVVTVRVDDAAPVPAVLDVMSPLTVVDAALDATPRRRGVDWRCSGTRAPPTPR